MTAMTRAPYVDPTDLQGIARLIVEATAGVTDLVEAMHRASDPVSAWIFGAPPDRAGGPAGLAYTSVRLTTHLVGRGLDEVLARLVPLLGQAGASGPREAVVAALNGVLGDHLAASGNPLAIPMRIRRDGVPLPLERKALAAALPTVGGRVLVLVHGSCMNDLQWTRNGHDHGAALARDLGLTPVYVHYNSGLHLSQNGKALSGLLESLVAAWPVPVTSLSVVCHSMGGLVARSAVHHASLGACRWPALLRHLVFLATPHHGAPMERGGAWLQLLLGVTPYTAPFGRLGRIRSAGITDLRHGSLLDEDWGGAQDRFVPRAERPRPVPLPAGVACFAVAATMRGLSPTLARHLVGDGMVLLESALGEHEDPERTLAFPPDHRWIAEGRHHLDVLDDPEVYAHLRAWLS